MPDGRIKIRDVLEKMLKENIATLPASLPLSETEVSLPQFVILNNNLDLSKTLQLLGLKDIFATKSGPVRSIKQNAYFATSFVSVNSVGTTNTGLCEFFFYIYLHYLYIHLFMIRVFCFR